MLTFSRRPDGNASGGVKAAVGVVVRHRVEFFWLFILLRRAAGELHTKVRFTGLVGDSRVDEAAIG